MVLIDSLEMGKKALAASQLAMTVTGQNISNANTDGYSRQSVQLASDSRLDDQFGTVGNGVSLVGIQRQRDDFVDEQLTGQISDQGYYQQVDTSLENVENTFNEPSDTGLNATLSTFYSSWQDLANNPNDIASREAVRSNSQNLVGQLHTISNQLSGYQSDVNDKISTTIDQINSDASKIKQLNDEIASAELGQDGQKANDSRDQRQLLLRDLGTQIPIQYIEDKQGRVSVTSNGLVLVGPTNTIQLQSVPNPSTNPDGSVSTTNSVMIQGTNQAFKPASGTLGGLMDVRDKIIPQYQGQLDQIAKTLVNSINQIHNNGYNMNGATGTQFFDPNGQNATTIQLSANILASANNIAAASSSSNTSVTLNNQALSGSPAALNLSAVNPQYRYVNSGSIQLSDAATGQVYTEGANATTGDYHVDYTSGNIIFNTGVTPPANVNVSFSFRSSTMSGVGDGSNALQIANLKDQNLMVPNAQGQSTQTVTQYYASVIGNLGIARNDSTNNLTTATATVQQLDNRQQQVSGVSLDEEMSNMILYEHTYEASARYITTINSMMDSIMSMVQ